MGLSACTCSLHWGGLGGNETAPPPAEAAACGITSFLYTAIPAFYLPVPAAAAAHCLLLQFTGDFSAVCRGTSSSGHLPCYTYGFLHKEGPAAEGYCIRLPLPGPAYCHARRHLIPPAQGPRSPGLPLHLDTSNNCRTALPACCYNTCHTYCSACTP